MEGSSKAMDDIRESTGVPRRSSRLHQRVSTGTPRAEASLLGMPTEIRLYIYDHFFRATENTRFRSSLCPKARKDDCALEESRSSDDFRGFVALLLTCRTTYHEAVDLLYSPVIRSAAKKNHVPHVFVSSEVISLSNFPGLFCRNHLVYRDGTAGLFRRIESLHVIILATFEHESGCACCGEWYPSVDLDMPQPFGFDDKSQTMDNVRWLADQLKNSGGFKHLAISLKWADTDDELDFPELEDAAWLMKPFKALRNVQDLNIPTLGTAIEMTMAIGDLEPETLEFWEEVIEYKKKMREILRSDAPVPENPISLPTWLSFKQTVKRLMLHVPQVGAHIYLKQAASAVDKQDKAVFQKALNGLHKNWKQEKKQRQNIELQFSSLRQAKLLDVPPGKRKEDDPEGMKFSKLSWGDPDIDKDDRMAYVEFLQSLDY